MHCSFIMTSQTPHALRGLARVWVKVGLSMVLALFWMGRLGVDAVIGGTPTLEILKPYREGPPNLTTTLTKIPLAFTQNMGQMDSQVRYYLHKPDMSVFFTSSEIVFSPRHDPRANAKESGVVRLRFDGALANSTVEGVDQLATVTNFFKGRDATKWVANAKNFGAVAYRQLYPGIDLFYRVKGHQIESEFVVSPGGNPKNIQLLFEGTQRLALREDGALVIHVAGGEFVETAPIAFQWIEGRLVKVPVKFQVLSQARVGLVLGQYNPRYPLTIDPVIAYSTYLGGSDRDLAWGIAVDREGNTYIIGSTGSQDFPTNNPFQIAQGDETGNAGSAFVAKINSSGTALVYATYLGGSRGAVGRAITVDDQGNAYLTGVTDSFDFPVRNAIQEVNGWVDRPLRHTDAEDAFVAKLNATGSVLIFSTYLGGDREEIGRGIAVDSRQNVYVVGGTNSDNFPTHNALQPEHGAAFRLGDAFITKINAMGSAFIYSTYLGGEDTEIGYGITVDNNGNAYVTGTTESSDFPTKNPLQGEIGDRRETFSIHGDAFVAKVNSAGSELVFSTYLGGNSGEVARAITLDQDNNIYVTGETWSTNFPTLNALQMEKGGARADAFITKINATGSALVFSTYLGGSENESGRSLAVDDGDNVYITGWTDSSNFPIRNAVQSRYGGETSRSSSPTITLGGEAFVTKLNAAGSELVYSTYLGGRASDAAHGIALDGDGNAYLTGTTASPDFPHHLALQRGFQLALQQEGVQLGPEPLPDVFVTKIVEGRCGGGFLPTADATIDAESPATPRGTAEVLVTGRRPGCPDPGMCYEDALLRFDLGSIPSGARIQRATMELYLRQWQGRGPFPVLLSNLENSWNETTVTWNRSPELFVTYNEPVVTPPIEYVAFEMTVMVQDWVNGTHRNHGVAVASPRTRTGDRFGLIFGSREDPRPHERPRLTVEWECSRSSEVESSEMEFSILCIPGTGICISWWIGGLILLVMVFPIILWLRMRRS